MRRFKIKDGMLWNDEDKIIAVVTEEVTQEEESILEASGEAVDAMKRFIGEINSGKFKPRAAVKSFENILERYGISNL